MLNRIFIAGRLVKEPEMRSIPGGQIVTTFTVAVDRDYVPQGREKETDYFDVAAWGKNGEFITKYFHKGNAIIVDGTMNSRKWEDRDGKKHLSWEIQMSKAWFGESKKRDGFAQMDGGEGYSRGEPQYKPAKKPQPYYEEELPF